MQHHCNRSACYSTGTREEFDDSVHRVLSAEERNTVLPSIFHENRAKEHRKRIPNNYQNKTVTSFVAFLVFKNKFLFCSHLSNAMIKYALIYLIKLDEVKIYFI